MGDKFGNVFTEEGRAKSAAEIADARRLKEAEKKAAAALVSPPKQEITIGPGPTDNSTDIGPGYSVPDYAEQYEKLRAEEAKAPTPDYTGMGMERAEPKEAAALGYSKDEGYGRERYVRQPTKAIYDEGTDRELSRTKEGLEMDKPVEKKPSLGGKALTNEEKKAGITEMLKTIAKSPVDVKKALLGAGVSIADMFAAFAKGYSGGEYKSLAGAELERIGAEKTKAQELQDRLAELAAQYKAQGELTGKEQTFTARENALDRASRETISADNSAKAGLGPMPTTEPGRSMWLAAMAKKALSGE